MVGLGNIDDVYKHYLVVIEENQQLKTQIAKLTEIVGVLPSNHSVGNLGYKIKNQRHEINNRLKEIDKLKELLKQWEHFYPIILYEHEDTLKTKDIVELFDKTREVLK